MSKTYAYGWNQKTGESYAEWKERLLIAQANENIETGLSWRMVAGILNIESVEQAQSEAEALLSQSIERKIEIEEAKDDFLQSEIGAAIDEKTRELDYQKRALSVQRNEVNKIKRQISDINELNHNLAMAMRMAANKPRHFFVTDIPQKNESKNEGAILFSDWHFGQNTVNAVNIYNETEFRRRIENLMAFSIKHGKENNINILHVFVLGDLIDGLIHFSNRVSQTSNAIVQTMEVAATLRDMLAQYAETFPEVKVYFTRGNHDRAVANLKENIPGENYIHIVQWFCENELKGRDNIEFINNRIDDEIVEANICGHLCYATHGHKDKPNKVITNLTSITRVYPDYIFLGHFHSPAELEQAKTTVVVNGSLCGPDEYAIGKRLISNAVQKFMIFNESGRIASYDIKFVPEYVN